MGQEVWNKLQGVLAGDEVAATWLYDAFAARLYRRLRQRYAYLGSEELEDLLHDVFVHQFRDGHRLLRGLLERVEPAQLTEARVERHLWDLACGLATNLRRSAALRRTVPLDTWEEPTLSPRAERRALDRDTLGRLDACLRESGERVYLYFQLRYRDGLTPEEIARATGWSRKATYKLKQSLNKAVERCATLLRLEGSDGSGDS